MHTRVHAGVSVRGDDIIARTSSEPDIVRDYVMLDDAFARKTIVQKQFLVFPRCANSREMQQLRDRERTMKF